MTTNGLGRAGTALITILACAVPAIAREESEAAANQEAQTAAGSSDSIEALRREIEKLRQEITLLQAQVDALRASGETSPPPPVSPPPQAPAGPARSQSLLNPAISGVLQSIGNTSLTRADQRNGFSLSEAEIAFQSAIDPYAKMDLFLTFPADGSAEVEEGYVTTLALPGSLALKGGRFKNAFGKWNTLHDHAFFTVDRPVALVNFLGDESLTDDGLSLSVLIPNPWAAYIESISEVGTPREGPSLNSARRDLSYLEHVSGVFTTSANSTIEIGLSAVRGRTGPTDPLLSAAADPNLGVTLAPGDHLVSEVDGVDLTYKWKPLQMNLYKSFLWQTEWLRSRRHVETISPALTLAPGVTSSSGGYTYVEGQFTKRWKFGGRFDFSELPDDASARESGGALVARFIPSEFQELRFQAERIHRNDLAAARFNGDRDDTRLLFEWIPVIGAHGAHKY
jgi:hypothetical protein